LIENSNFFNNWGSGLNLEMAVVHFKGVCTFYNNTALYGGGLLIEDANSESHIFPNTLLNFTNNVALITGGAMHIRKRFSTICFIQMSVGNLSVVDGILVCWSAGLLDCWSAGLLDCWTAGLLVCWTAGLLVCWTAGLLSHCLYMYCTYI